MSLEKFRVAGGDTRVDADTEIDPVAHDVAVVINGMQGISKACVGLMVATASAQVANATGEGQQVLDAAVRAANAGEAVLQPTAFEEGVDGPHGNRAQAAITRVMAISRSPFI